MNESTATRVPIDISACPHLKGYDPRDPAHLINPYPHLERARSEAPVFYSPEIDMWTVTRYDLVRQILAEPDAYSNEEMIRTPDVPAEFRDRMEYFPVEEALVAMDPPEHTPIRKLAAKGFGPQAVKAREPQVRERAHALVDEFIQDGRADIVQRYCDIIPVATIASMFGLSTDMETVEKLQQWTRSALALMLEFPDHARTVELAGDMHEYDVFIREVIEERRSEPGDDVLSLLIDSTDESGKMSLDDKQLVGMVGSVLVGGSDTTASLISRSIYELLIEPKRWARLREDPSIAPAVIEETLRMYGTVIHLMRVTKRDVEIEGVTIPKGSWVCISLASADRDDAVFSDPNTFDIDRPKSEQSQHMAFGKGAHFCLGAPFARAEAKIALEVLVERIPSIRLADPEVPLDINPTLMITIPQHLDVVWDTEATTGVGASNGARASSS